MGFDSINYVWQPEPKSASLPKLGQYDAEGYTVKAYSYLLGLSDLNGLGSFLFPLVKATLMQQAPGVVVADAAAKPTVEAMYKALGHNLSDYYGED